MYKVISIFSFIMICLLSSCAGQTHADNYTISLKDTVNYRLSRARSGDEGQRSEMWINKTDPSSYFMKSYKYDKVDAIGFYKNRKRNGPYILYDANGQPSMEGYYKDGKMNGIFKYYKDKEIIVSTFRDDSLINKRSIKR